MAHICEKCAFGAAGFLGHVLCLEQLFLRLLAVRNLFFQLSRSCLQLIISASQCCIPVLDVGQHGVKTVDETTDLVSVTFDRPNLIVLVGGHHSHGVLQVHN